MGGRDGVQLQVLISGAGVAGLTAANFLLRAGHHVTINERASALRASGQTVDIRGHGLTVLRRMRSEALDIEAVLRSKASQEEGLQFVDASNRCWAAFPVEAGTSFTGEIEIMRGDLVNALYGGIKNMPRANVIFGEEIASIEQTQSGRTYVRSKPGRSGEGEIHTNEFDVIIAADGIGSYTRRMAFGDDPEVISPLEQWSCWFSLPRNESDGNWARWYNAPRGRMILIRPDRGDFSRVSLWTMTRDASLKQSLSDVAKADVDEQRTFWCRLFVDAGWEAPRVVQALEDANDFHMQEVAQVQTRAWSVGRVVLVGDAGYCPSPISGMGVTTAMTGAYVLAGEINKSPTDIQGALKAYEEKMRPFVTVAQKLAPGTPGVANPESAWGIRLLYSFLGFVSWTKLYKFFGSSVNPPSQAMQLPDYEGTL